MSNAELLRLRKTIDDVAYASGQQRPEIYLGLNKIVEQTGDLQFARDVMLDLAIASTATGAGMEYLGALAVQLRDKMRMGKEEIKASLNLLTVQGKAGAFTLENLATLGERLFAAAGRFNMRGIQDVATFGAFLQIARMGTGSSEQAATATENVLADILDKSKEIKKTGFNIFKDNGDLKKFDEIIKGIIVATKGNEVKLGSIFGRESIRAMTVLASTYRETKGFALFDELTKADAGKSNEIMADFARYSQSAKYQLQQLSNVVWDFADAALSPIIGDLSTKLKDLTNDPEKMQKFISDVKQMGASFGDTATSLLNIVDALNKLVPLLKLFGIVSDAAAGTADFIGGSIKTTAIATAGAFNLDPNKNTVNKTGLSLLSLDPSKNIINQTGLKILDLLKNSIKIENKITINQDANGKTIVKSDSPNAKVSLNRGSFGGVR
jgi:TP901 family phage tail tape measure protein